MRLIDADEFRELIDGGYDLNFDDVPNTKKELLRMIDDAPTVDAVERKRGKWIEENRRPKSMMFYCSVCHRTAYDPQNHHGGQKRCRYAFCPNCGADMRTKETDCYYEIAIEQLEHDILYEPTFNPEDGSM